MRKIYFLFFLLNLCLPGLIAQEVLSYSNPEEGFTLMRKHASDGDLAAAKNLGYKLLAENEAYYDVTLYLARVHGWGGEFAQANLLVDSILARESGLYEAYEVCFDLARWEKNANRMEYCTHKARAQFPDSTFTPGKQRAMDDKEENGTDFFALYTYDHFAKPYIRNWHMMTLGMRIPIGKLTLLPYLNTGIHPGDGSPSGDFQLNMDAYISLSEKTYALAGYGFSPDGELNFLPVHRAAAEVWQMLPAGFGLSAGLRYFYWESHFTFLTYSVEKYAGNYWFSFRNYLFFKDYGISGSYYLTARRYFATKNDHLSLVLGYGTAPDEPLVVISDLDRLDAFSARISLTKQLGRRIRAVAMLSYAREEYADALLRNRWGMQLGCYYRIGK